MKLLATIGILTVASTISCNTQSNEFDAMAYECRVSAAETKSLVKVFDSFGEAIIGADLVGFVLKGGSKDLAIQFTETGCFTPPHEGEVFIRDREFKISSRMQSSQLQGIQAIYLNSDPSTIIKPSTPIEDIRDYFGRDYYFVNPGYRLNLYSNKSLKNLDIEYCVEEIDPEEPFSSESACDESQYKYFFATDPLEFNQGFWRVNYRTNEQQDPVTIYIAVENHCPGSFTDENQFFEQRCTSIGNFYFEKREIRRNIDLTKFRYLSKVEGAFRVGRAETESLMGLENLRIVNEFVYSSETLKDISQLKLKRVLGEFRLADAVDLKSLDALASTEFLGNVLDLKDLGIEDIGFLEGTVNLGHSLSLDNLPNLKNLDGLQDVEMIEGYLEMARLPLIKSLAPLKSLKKVSRYLRLDTLGKLEIDEGLSQLETVGITLALYDLDFLTDFSFLKNLRNIGLELSLGKNGYLKSFKGLEGVQFRRLAFSQSYGVSTLEGLEHLTEIESIYINNTNLVSLEGLNNLEKISTLSLSNNVNLRNITNMSLESVGTLALHSNHSLNNIRGLRDAEIETVRVSKAACGRELLLTLRIESHPIKDYCASQ